MISIDKFGGATLVLCALITVGCTDREQVTTAYLSEHSSKVYQIDGVWRGQIQRVSVFDGRGNSYDAAQLRVTEGPHFSDPYANMNSYPGAGTLPLLTCEEGSEARLADVAKLPVGKVVELRGTMVITAAHIRESEGPMIPRWQVSRQLKNDGEPKDEHLIVVSGKPQVFRKPEQIMSR